MEEERTLVGEIRSQIESIWNDFWQGGVSNPLSVIEQITYLLFIRRLDDMVIDQVTERGRMEPRLHHESPFTDLDPRGLAGVFGDDSAQVVTI